MEAAEKAGLKRPATYNMVDDLLKIGLVSKIPRGKKTYLKPENPLFLINIIKNKEKDIQTALPLLQSAFSKTLDRPTLKLLEGEQAMMNIREEWLTAESIRFFGSIELLKDIFPEHHEKTLKTVKRKNIKVKEILANTPKNVEYAEKEQSENYKIRILPEDLGVNMDCAIYNNKLTIFSLVDELYVIIIEDKNIVKSFRSLHELAWRGANKL